MLSSKKTPNTNSFWSQKKDPISTLSEVIYDSLQIIPMPKGLCLIVAEYAIQVEPSKVKFNTPNFRHILAMSFTAFSMGPIVPLSTRESDNNFKNKRQLR